MLHENFNSMMVRLEVTMKQVMKLISTFQFHDGAIGSTNIPPLCYQYLIISIP